MKRRFIISIAEESETAVKKMVDLLNRLGAPQWWHYFNGLWLVIDEKGDLDTAKIRDEIKVVFPKMNQMVFEISPGGTCSGFGPKEADQWLFDQWLVK